MSFVQNITSNVQKTSTILHVQKFHTSPVAVYNKSGTSMARGRPFEFISSIDSTGTTVFRLFAAASGVEGDRFKLFITTRTPTRKQRIESRYAGQCKISEN